MIMAQAKMVGSGWHGQTIRHRQARLFGKATKLKRWNVATYQDNPEIWFAVVAPNKKEAMKAVNYHWNKYGSMREYPLEETDYQVGQPSQLPEESEWTLDDEYKSTPEEAEKYNKHMKYLNEDADIFLDKKKAEEYNRQQASKYQNIF